MQHGHSSVGLAVTGHHRAPRHLSPLPLQLVLQLIEATAPKQPEQRPENNIYIFITFSLNTCPSVKQSHI